MIMMRLRLERQILVKVVKSADARKVCRACRETKIKNFDHSIPKQR